MKKKIFFAYITKNFPLSLGTSQFSFVEFNLSSKGVRLFLFHFDVQIMLHS